MTEGGFSFVREEECRSNKTREMNGDSENGIWTLTLKMLALWWFQIWKVFNFNDCCWSYTIVSSGIYSCSAALFLHTCPKSAQELWDAPKCGEGQTARLLLVLNVHPLSKCVFWFSKIWGSDVRIIKNQPQEMYDYEWIQVQNGCRMLQGSEFRRVSKKIRFSISRFFFSMRILIWYSFKGPSLTIGNPGLLM